MPGTALYQRVKSKIHLGRAQSEAGLARLIEWAQGYYTRTDLRSQAGHRLLFNAFSGERICFATQEEVDSYLRDIQHSAAAGAYAPLS